MNARMGQDKPVSVCKIVTVGMFEEVNLGRQARRQALADGLFDPEAGTGALLTEDYQQSLFAPLPNL